MQSNAHKTAMTRSKYSMPVQRALDEGIINRRLTFFDYGCGKGGDVLRLEANKYRASGFDPYYGAFGRQGARRRYGIVNLGYVLNAIDDPETRANALRSAWAMTAKTLIVSVRTDSELKGLVDPTRSGDGWVTQSGTFQKFYGREEIRDYIVDTLGVIPVWGGNLFYYAHRKPRLTQ